MQAAFTKVILFFALLIPLLWATLSFADVENGLKDFDRDALENAELIEIRLEAPVPPEKIKGDLTQIVHQTSVSRENFAPLRRVLYTGFSKGGFYRDWGPTLLKLPLLPKSFKDDVLAVTDHPYFAGETYVVKVPGALTISVFYRGFYAMVDSRVKSSAGDFYEIPIVLDYTSIEQVEKLAGPL